MKKSILAILLVTALLAALLAGCANGTTAAATTAAAATTTAAATTAAAATTTAAATTAAAADTTAAGQTVFNETGYPIMSEETTFTAMNSWYSEYNKWGDDQALLRAMHELTNITFDFENVPSTDWDTKLNLSFASGNLPDIYMSTIGTANAYTYGVKGGVLYEFSDKIDQYMPNLIILSQDFPNMMKISLQNDGGMYTLPALSYTATRGSANVYVRTDYMDECGITEEPATTAELYDLCVALKEQYADMEGFIPFMTQGVSQFNSSAEGEILPAFGEYVTSTYNVDQDGKVFFNGVTDQMLTYLEYCNRLYTEGLLNPEMYTMDGSTALALIQNGQCGITTYGTVIKIETFASGNYDVSLLGPLTSEYNTDKKWPLPDFIYDSGFAITTKCEYPDALLRWFDILYSKDDVAPGLNATSGWLGIRGETYDYTDDTHQFYKRLAPEGTDNINVWVASYASPQLIFGMKEMAIADDASAGLKVKGLCFIEKQLPYGVDVFPLSYLKYADADTETYNTLTTDINAYVDQMKAKFITGAESLDNWDAYAANLEKMGLSDVVSIIQGGYDEFIK